MDDHELWEVTMSVVSTRTKAKLGTNVAPKLGTKVTKAVASRPRLVPLSVRASSPIIKRRARRRMLTIGDTARTYGELLVTHGPSAAQELGLVSAPKPKRTAPAVAAGVTLGP